MNILDKIRLKYGNKKDKLPKLIVNYILSKLEENSELGKKYYKIGHLLNLETDIGFCLEGIDQEIMGMVEVHLRDIGVKTKIKKHDTTYYFDEYIFYWE